MEIPWARINIRRAGRKKPREAESFCHCIQHSKAGYSRRRRHLRKAVVALLLVVLTLAAVGGVAAAQSQVLRVGVNAAFPPFEYVDEVTGEILGFDIALIREIAARLGMEVEIINTAWEGIIPGLLAGHYDVIISAMTITDERVRAVDFSDPYFATGQVIVVRSDDDRIKEPADLMGKVVAVQIGSTGHFAAETIPGVLRIDPYPLAPEAFLALKTGRADAVVVDELVAILEDRANPGEIKVVGTPFTIEYYGIALRKGREDLLRAINRTLAQIRADGTYDKLYNEWILGQ
nr:basic amino acid ABC transporter substrate-binding protein [Bacillota bacterium]